MGAPVGGMPTPWPCIETRLVPLKVVSFSITKLPTVTVQLPKDMMIIANCRQIWKQFKKLISDTNYILLYPFHWLCHVVIETSPYIQLRHTYLDILYYIHAFTIITFLRSIRQLALYNILIYIYIYIHTC